MVRNKKKQILKHGEEWDLVCIQDHCIKDPCKGYFVYNMNTPLCFFNSLMVYTIEQHSEGW